MGKARPSNSITGDGLGEYVEHPSPLVCRRCGKPMVAVWCRRERKERDLDAVVKSGKVVWRKTAKEVPVGLKCGPCDIWINADVEREAEKAASKRRTRSVSRESQGLKP